MIEPGLDEHALLLREVPAGCGGFYNANSAKPVLLGASIWHALRAVVPRAPNHDFLQLSE